MTPTLDSWFLFAATFAVETALMVGLAAGACRLTRNAKRHRVCWQASLIAVTLIFLSEWTGLHTRLQRWLPTQSAHRRLVVSVSDPRLDDDPRNMPLPGASAIAPNARARDSVTWPGWLWISGTFTLLLIGGSTRVWLLVERRKMRPAGLEIWAIAKPLFAPLRLPQATICAWKRARGPVAFGLWRPTVALPSDFVARFTRQQQKVMLAHELAHLAAHDPFWFDWADIFCAIAWWHPGAWWMRRQFRQACEGAADEASALIPEGRATLAESLVAFGRELSLSGPTGGLGVAGSGLRSELGLRVRTLLEQSTMWQDLSLPWRWAPRFLGIVCAGVTVATPIHAANPAWSLVASVAPGESKADSVTRMGPPQMASLDSGHELQSVALVVQFIEVEETNDSEKQELDALFGHHPQEPKTEKGPALDVFPDKKLPSQRNVVADRSRTDGQAAVISEARFAELRRLLSQQGVNWLQAPPVETPIGKQAHVETLDAKTIVFDVKTINGTRAHPGASISYETGDVLLGPTADIVTHRANDGCRLDVRAKFVEFLGYDDPGSFVPEARAWVDATSPPSEPVKAMLPVPHFRVRGSQASAVAKLGQTVALRGPLATETEIIKEGLAQAEKSQTSTNRFYVFVTLEPPASLRRRR